MKILEKMVSGIFTSLIAGLAGLYFYEGGYVGYFWGFVFSAIVLMRIRESEV